MPTRNLQIIIVALFIAVICYTTARRARKAILVGDAIDLVDRFFVDPVNDQELLEAAMEGITSQLDEHSEYIPAAYYEAFQDAIHQEFAGIGILVDQPQSGQPVRVVTPLVGSPALQAGLLPGDEILRVDGEDVSEMEIRDVSNRLRGPVGTVVTLTIRRDALDDLEVGNSADDPKTGVERLVVVKRQSIAIESVVGDHRTSDNRWSFRLEDHPDIAYIRITSFGDRTAGELRQALSQLDNQFDSLILDVRSNAGGLLLSAVEVCDDFLEEGRVVTIRKRGGEIDSEFNAKPGLLVRRDKPIVVLIDGNSASASEIVAACLQDHGRAKVIGSRSYGKGTVQNVLPLDYGRSALKLTTARYYRPNGKNIHRLADAGDGDEWGVTPDDGFDVAVSDEDFLRVWQRWQESSYPRLGGKPNRTAGKRSAEAVIGKGTASDDGLTPTGPLPATIDPPLLRAIEHLRGIKANRPAVLSEKTAA